MEIVSSSIIEIVNLNDTKPLQLFLSSNQPKTQVYNSNTGVYTPNWNTSKPVITPELYVAGTSTNILAQAKSITWYNGASAIVSGTDYTLGTGNNSLTINRNILAGKNLVPSFDSSQWFADSTGAGKITVDATDRYKMTLTITATSNGRLVWIPVVNGKTYTVSCDAATTGLRKVYKGQQTSDSAAAVIATNNATTTFTVDDTYNGYVTIRLTYGSPGSYVFQGIQMEEGSTATAFAPMTTNGTKNINCTVVYTDPDTGYDITTQAGIDFTFVSSGQTGFQGDLAGDIGYLTNDNASIATANDGSGGTYGAPNAQTTLKIFRGLKDVTSEYTIAQTRTNVTVTEATNSDTATVTAMSADTGNVKFTATLAGYPTITRTFYLMKNKMGLVGQTPSSYWLSPNTSQIIAAEDGSLSPATITFKAQYQSGTNAPAGYSGRFVVYESYDGNNNFMTTYTSAADESSITYTPVNQGITVVRVKLFRSGGTSTQLDEQFIPIVSSGKNSVTLSTWTPTGDVIRNAGNNVTAQADLFNGSNPVTGSNYRWFRQNPQATAGDDANDYISQVYDADFAKGNAMWSDSYAGQTVTPTSVGTAATVDGKSVLRISGTYWLYALNPIPVDVNKTYSMTFSVKQETDATTGGMYVYAGVATLDANFNSITGGSGTHRYFCASSTTITSAQGWRTFTGTITGVGDNPNQFRAGTAYVRPMFIVNYNGGNGTVVVDQITFTDVQSQTDAQGWEALDFSKRNLLINSTFNQGNWGISSSYGSVLPPEPDKPNSSIFQLQYSSSTLVNTPLYAKDRVYLTPAAGDKITFSMDFYCEDYSTYGPQSAVTTFRRFDAQTGGNYVVANESPTLANYGISTASTNNGKWVRGVHTYTFDSSTAVAGWYNFGLYMSIAAGTSIKFKYREIKMELGGVSTPWMLAYEDFAVDQNDSTMYGKNLVLNTEFNTLNNWNTTASGPAWALDATKYNGYNVMTCDRSSLAVSVSTYGDLTQTIPYPDKIQLNVPYTVSFYVKVTAGAGATKPFTWYLTDITGTSPDNNWTPLSATTGWTKVYKTITFTTKQNGNIPRMYFRCFDGSAVSITQPKFEQLPYATDYSPAPEDNSTTYPNNAAGAGKWIFKQLPDSGSGTVATYDQIKSFTSGIQTLIPDGTDIVKATGNTYYTGYLKTAVYALVAKSITLGFQHDDGAEIYINGIKVYSNLNYSSTQVTRTFNLKKGWNTIEVIYRQGTGGDGFYNVSPILSSVVDEVNGNYALDYGSLKGQYGLMGYNTSSMIVTPAAVTNIEQFKCLATYRGTVYSGIVTINDVSDPITLSVVGTNLFKNGQGSNPYTAKLFQNGVEIDTDGTKYTYNWYVYNQDGTKDTNFGGVGYKTGKTINVAASDITYQGRLVCEVND